MQMEGPAALIDALPAAIPENSISPWQTLPPRDEKPQHSLKQLIQPEVIQSLHGPGNLLISHSNANNTTPWPQTGSPQLSIQERPQSGHTCKTSIPPQTGYPYLIFG